MPARPEPISALKHELHYLSALPFSVIAIDADFRVCYLNPAAEAWLEFSALHCADAPLTPWLLFDAARRGVCLRVLAGGEAVSLYEHALCAPHSPEMQATLHIMPVFSEGQGHPAQLLLIVEQQERLTKLAEQALQKEAARAAGLMAAQLAHEVKNPLSSIRGAAQLLRDETNDEQQKLADLICVETDRIRDLLNQVEIFDAQTPVVLQPVNIHEVLRHVIRIARTGFGRHVEFRERYDPSLPEVAAQRDLLVQLFLNLVKNAGEAMAGQTPAVLTLSTSFVHGYHANDRQRIRVSVEDNGPGIDAELRAQLFAPFVSTKEQGRGLGLAIVSKIAGDLGAVVEVGEAKREGAVFNVVLLSV